MTNKIYFLEYEEKDPNTPKSRLKYIPHVISDYSIHDVLWEYASREIAEENILLNSFKMFVYEKSKETVRPLTKEESNVVDYWLKELK